MTYGRTGSCLARPRYIEGRMDWNTLTLVTLAVFGFAGLVVMLLIGFLRQLPELVRAVREVKDALGGGIERE